MEIIVSGVEEQKIEVLCSQRCRNKPRVEVILRDFVITLIEIRQLIENLGASGNAASIFCPQVAIHLFQMADLFLEHRCPRFQLLQRFFPVIRPRRRNHRR